VVRFYALAALVVISIPILLAIAPRDWQNSATEVEVALFLLVVGLGFRAAIRQNQAERRERDAGYTTLYGTWLKLWQLDAKTGEVLRRPGEPAIRRRRGSVHR
jgi:hypothetical protein